MEQQDDSTDLGFQRQINGQTQRKTLRTHNTSLGRIKNSLFTSTNQSCVFKLLTRRQNSVWSSQGIKGVQKFKLRRHRCPSLGLVLIYCRDVKSRYSFKLYYKNLLDLADMFTFISTFRYTVIQYKSFNKQIARQFYSFKSNCVSIYFVLPPIVRKSRFSTKTLALTSPLTSSSLRYVWITILNSPSLNQTPN